MPEQKRHRRLDEAGRAAVERGLDAKRSCRQVAGDPGRSPSSVSAEAEADGTVAKGAGKGERASSVPEGACPKPLARPHARSGCGYRRRHCPKKRGCERSAARAQALPDDPLPAARRGADRDEDELEAMTGAIRGDVARGLPPCRHPLSAHPK